jgi:hypothetical protein
MKNALVTFIQWANQSWLAALCVAQLYFLVILMQLSIHNFDPSYFISIGDRYIIEPENVPDNVSILPDSSGYDGQFYYQLGLNPFQPQPVNGGLSISNGPYRHQRIVYPVLAWLFSFGNPDLLPAALLLVNYLALIVLGWLGAQYARLHQRHALWGVLVALYPGFLFSLTRDLTEILGVMFLLAGIIRLGQSSGNIGPTILFTLAIFTRETSFLAVVALAIAFILSKTYRRWPVVIIPLTSFALWQIALWSKWGQFPILAGQQNIGIPGQGLTTFIRSLERTNFMHQVWMLELGLVVMFAAAAAYSLCTTKGTLHHILIWLGYGVLVLSLTRHVWIEDLAYMRAISEFFLFSLLFVIAGLPSRGLIIMATSLSATWLIVFFTRLNW